MMERDNFVTELPVDSNQEPDAELSASEVLECGIGGCRFGVLASDVISTDVWAPEYLTRLANYSEAVLGTIFYDGQPLPVVDLRHLFCPDEDLPEANLMSIIVSYQSCLFVLMVDGLISLESVSMEAFQSFSSLYVCGVKWLSGALILEDRAIPMLDLKSLFELTRSTV